MNGDSIAIVGMARTPMGGFQGDLGGARAPELGAVAIGAALERAGLEGDAVDEVIMGNILSAGQGQAPARQASMARACRSMWAVRPLTRCAAPA